MPNTEFAINALRPYKGIQYGYWVPPEQVWHKRIPTLSEARKTGLICSEAVNIIRLASGRPIKPLDHVGYTGGTYWWGEKFNKKEHRYVSGRWYPKGTLFGTPYRGPKLALQGHVFVSTEDGVNPRLIQSVAAGGGVTERYRLSDMQRPTYAVVPGRWLGKAVGEKEPAGNSGPLLLSGLLACWHSLPDTVYAAWHDALNNAARKYGITTYYRMCHWLAQMGHESNDGYYRYEIWGPTAAQKGYEGRRDLGNVYPGDGYRYRGRGFLQLTGRANYRRVGRALGMPLEANPDLAAKPEGAFMIAAHYFYSRGLLKYCDQGDAGLKAVTYRVNGGYNGYNDRVRRYQICKSALAG